MTRHPHLHNHTPSKSPELLANSYQVFGCSSAQSRVLTLAESTRQSCYSGYSESPETPRPVRSPRPAQTRPLVPLPRRGPGSATSQNLPKRNLRDATCRRPTARSTDPGSSVRPLYPRAQVLPEGPAARPNFRSEFGLRFLCWGTGVMAEGAKVAEPFSAAGR